MNGAAHPAVDRSEPASVDATKSVAVRKPGVLTRLRPPLRMLVAALWLLVTGAGLTALGLAWSPVTTPSWLAVAGAVTVTTTFTFGLTARTGGRAAISGLLALGLSSAAALSGLPVLLAGAALGTAVVAAVFGVMATKPAAGFAAVIRECLVAVAVGTTGAFAVEAYQAEVSIERFSYLALGLALLGAMGLVYRLGAGLQGLGKRGVVMVVSGLVLLTVSMAYTEALARWGSPGLGNSIEGFREAMLAMVGAVSRPVEFLLGIPALAWGVSTRARRRQGWWVCAFGAAGVVGISVSLLDPTMSLVEAGLSVLYSLIIGLFLGYLVIRADKFLTGARGRRARQLEEAAAHRPEPSRMQALL